MGTQTPDFDLDDDWEPESWEDELEELEKLMDAKVFLELWVKVRSGWADDEARVRSFGYE